MADIVIIEDNPANLELMSYLLEAFGHRIRTAIDGGDGLELVRRVIPELIICDVHLPKVDGYEVARTLKRDPKLSHIPLLAVTALAMVGDREKGMEAGFDGYLYKPIEIETFVPEVERFLRANRLGILPPAAASAAQAAAEPGQKRAAMPAAADSKADSAGPALESALEKTAAVATEPQDRPDPAAMPPAILVVDDRAINREFLVALLACVGYRTFDARNGAQALDIAKREAIALVISDILMPVMDGLEFVKRLHADPETASIPVIFYTATYRTGEARMLSQNCGVVAILAKPAEPQTILHTVATILGGSGMIGIDIDATLQTARILPEVTGLQYRLQAACASDETLSMHRPGGAMYAPGNLQALSFRTAALLELSMTLSLQREPQRLLDVFCEAAQEVMNAKFAVVVMCGDGQPQRFAQRGMSDAEVESIFRVFNPRLGEIAEFLHDGKLLRMGSGSNHPIVSRLPPPHPFRRPAIFVPIVLMSHAYGWLCVADKLGAGAFNEEDEQFADTLAVQLAPIYENMIFYHEIQQRTAELEAESGERRRIVGLYEVISGVNAAIVRIRDRRELFRQVCQTAVIHGGFSVVWVGAINQNTLDGEVTAWSGCEAADLEYVRFSPRAGTPYSDQPACVAAREMRPVVCNDIDADRSLIALRPIFQARGHRSLAVWPLVMENRAVAVIAFFAQKEQFFDQREIDLLDQLASDLSFGLQFISNEEKEARLAERWAVTMEGITDAFIMLDRGWNFTYLNQHAERLLRCQREEVLGRSVWEQFPEAVGGRYYREYHKAIEQNCSVSFEEYYEPLDLWTEIRAYPSAEGLAVYFVDISARKTAEAEIHELAFFDKLTALPNRRLLLNRLEHTMALRKRANLSGAVLFIDLDNFKSINDTRGHDKGDILLQQVACRLKSAVRASDTVARIGGDEYVILLDDLGGTSDEVELNANTVADSVLESFKEPFDIDGLWQHSSCSIGVALFDEQTTTVDEVLKRADLAMYQAKAAGRNAKSFFSPDMQARLSKRVALETDLRHAFSKQEFLLHYQPQIDADGCIFGVEALVRWACPVRGLVPPVDFIGLAEDTGLILPLGRWVMKTACDLLSKWEKCARSKSLIIAVNVSARQFHRPDFVEQVLSVIAETGANPRRLTLELTESLLVTDIEGTIRKMGALKKIGILFALDDFGTGYSSLSYLHRLPLDQLKIDRSFIRDALNDENAAVIVRTVHALGRALNLAVIAEGVETREQYELVRREGCKEYQGYLFSKPLPEPDLDQFIANAAAGTRAG